MSVTRSGDLQAIRQACTDYIESWLDGDVERMRRCLHPRLAKRRVKDADALATALVASDFAALEMLITPSGFN